MWHKSLLFLSRQDLGKAVCLFALTFKNIRLSMKIRVLLETGTTEYTNKSQFKYINNFRSFPGISYNVLTLA